MPIEMISFCGIPRAMSSRTMTAARLPDSSLLCSALPLESVCPETSNLKSVTPATLRRFFISTSVLARFFSLLSQPGISSSLSVLKLHWFLRPSAISFVFTSLAALSFAAPPALLAAFLVRSPRSMARAGAADIATMIRIPRKTEPIFSVFMPDHYCGWARSATRPDPTSSASEPRHRLVDAQEVAHALARVVSVRAPQLVGARLEPQAGLLVLARAHRLAQRRVGVPRPRQQQRVRQRIVVDQLEHDAAR